MMTIEQEAHSGVFVRRGIEFILAASVLLLGLMVLLLRGAWNDQTYALLDSIAPARAWGTVWLVLGTTRCVVLIINGFWPLSPLARFSLASATLLLAWLPLASTHLAYFRAFLLDHSGGATPGLILAGMAVMTEGLCMYALAALREARKHGG